MRELLIAVQEVVDGANLRLRATLAEHELTLPLSDVLWMLDPALPAPAMKELAARLHCDPSSVTFLIKRLEERGLVERRPDPADSVPERSRSPNAASGSAANSSRRWSTIPRSPRSTPRSRIPC
ncbi:MarR family winged helix-turn-helix transcriptional regulator [Actinomadura sp. 9N407]|uniref:MarR family winged helix-turn-helix transcriptional regulator n=1 Tax=Actinomadura sp. 9N407 TaxID=3375154 RepID=UPI0037AF766B